MASVHAMLILTHGLIAAVLAGVSLRPADLVQPRRHTQNGVCPFCGSKLADFKLD
jgi:hypothetical protein